MIRAIILDCGGVMCRPKNGEWLLPGNLAEVTGGALMAYDPKRIADAYERAGAYLDEGQFITTQKSECEKRYLFTREMSRLLDAGLTDAKARAIAVNLTYDDARYHFYGDTRAYLAKWSQEYLLCMLSNAMPSLYRAMVNGGYDSYLDSMIISTFVGMQKPDRRMYELALRSIDVRPEEAVFVDDLNENLIAAREAGLQVIRMQRSVYTRSRPQAKAWDGAEATDFQTLDALIESGAVFS